MLLVTFAGLITGPVAVAIDRCVVVGRISGCIAVGRIGVGWISVAVARARVVFLEAALQPEHPDRENQRNYQQIDFVPHIGAPPICRAGASPVPVKKPRRPRALFRLAAARYTKACHPYKAGLWRCGLLRNRSR